MTRDETFQKVLKSILAFKHLCRVCSIILARDIVDSECVGDKILASNCAVKIAIARHNCAVHSSRNKKMSKYNISDDKLDEINTKIEKAMDAVDEVVDKLNESRHKLAKVTHEIEFSESLLNKAQLQVYDLQYLLRPESEVEDENKDMFELQKSVIQMEAQELKEAALVWGKEPIDLVKPMSKINIEVKTVLPVYDFTKTE